MPYLLGQLAEAHGKLGRPADGLALLDQALPLTESTDERWYESELHRLKGDLLLQADRPARGEKRRAAGKRKPAPDVAEASLQTALAVARRQQAKSLELRAAMSLSRLWQQRGQRRQAHELLSETFAWFREGFTTADLRDAQALLAELA
jgi:predicted ATPase